MVSSLSAEQVPSAKARLLSEAFFFESERLCACGHDKFHHMVTAKGDYTAIGWFWVMFGVSTKPRQLKFTCRTCHEVVAVTKDDTLLSQHL